MSAQTPRQVKDLLQRHRIRPRKALGQHFLADPNLVEKIVAAAEVEAGAQVVEVGAGTGTLTGALAETGARVVTYETDTGLRPILEEVLGGLPNVEVRWSDVTRVDLATELNEGGWIMVANLPYQVATPLITDVLRKVPQVERMVVMIQREVADRITARPGSRVYGLPSVVVGLHASSEVLFRVPPQVFVPPPRVESAVVRVIRKPAHPHSEEAVRLAAQAFAGRRKMLRRSLGFDPETFLRAGVDPEARPERLAPADWLRLVEATRG